MPDDTNPSPEAEALARVMWPDFDRETYPSTWLGMIHQAQRAINAGWTPPPDPHKDIARDLMTRVYGTEGVAWTTGGRLWPKMVDALRDMDLRRGDQ